MADTAGDSSTFRISTGAFPKRERVAVWRELYGRKLLRLEVEPLIHHPFSSDLTVHALPGLALLSGTISPARLGRTRELIADGNDSLVVPMATCDGVARRLGHEISVSANDAIMLSNADIGSFTFRSTARITALLVSRETLQPLLRDFHALLARPVPRDSEALRLLRRYLPELSNLLTPELQRLAVTHVCDLLSLALGATRDAAEIAKGRGLRVARLHAIKTDIGDNLCDPALSIQMIARRQRITPVYVRKLFESEGSSYSEYVVGERLKRAHRMLYDGRFHERTISAIAFDCGFGDLSYFNRAFRRRFASTPSDVREAGRSLTTADRLIVPSRAIRAQAERRIKASASAASNRPS